MTTQIIPGSLSCQINGMLPDGEYEGVWGGYVVTVNFSFGLGDLKIKMAASDGIRTVASPCVVTIKDGVATVKTK